MGFRCPICVKDFGVEKNDMLKHALKCCDGAALDVYNLVTENRERSEKVLYYHPESDCYFYEDPLLVEDELCEDVSGIKEHEEEAARRGVFLDNREEDRCELS